MFKENVSTFVLWFFFLATVALAVTGVWFWVFSGDCAAAGGVVSIDGGTAWCRY